MKKIFYLFFVLLFYSYSRIVYSQELFIIESEYLPANDTIKVFVPTNYDMIGESLPLVFMLHGWDGNYNQWSEITDLQKYSDKYNFILVCPDGLIDSWYIDSPVDNKFQFEKFFIYELFPEVLKKYKVDKTNVFITGLSMGGFGAISFFIKYNNLFKAAASTSGILDIVPFKGKWGMDDKFDSLENYNKYSPLNNINSVNDTTKKIFIDCGIDDFAYNVNKMFYEECKRNHLDAVFISKKGNHSRAYWKESIDMHMYFFSREVLKSK
ncbi:MAG: alpha/beta hydrolase [Syntrophothermus sp.]